MRLSILVLLLAQAGCGSDSNSPHAAFVTDQRMVYSDGLHNENTEMIRLGDRIVRIFRGGEEGHRSDPPARAVYGRIIVGERLRWRGRKPARTSDRSRFRDLHALDLRLHVDKPQHAAAAEALTAAVAALAPDGAVLPDRCRLGIKRKACSIPHNYECDTRFGIGDGLCDVGTGVLFDPPLEPAAQVSTCTPSVDVVVAAGTRLKLPARARTGSGRRDNDMVRLVCVP
jgi:hypothetical protein